MKYFKLNLDNPYKTHSDKKVEELLFNLIENRINWEIQKLEDTDKTTFELELIPGLLMQFGDSADEYVWNVMSKLMEMMEHSEYKMTSFTHTKDNYSIISKYKKVL